MRTLYRSAVIPSSAALPALLILSSCSGPQPLSKAIDPKDDRDYVAMQSATQGTPADAYLQAKATASGRTLAQVRQADLALSKTSNPYRRSDHAIVSQGAAIYKHECAACHGDNADGRGPSLPSPLPSLDFHRMTMRMDITMHGGAVGKWFNTIQNGATASIPSANGTPPASVVMPPFKDRLCREQTWLVITYLQSLDCDLPAQSAEAKQ